VSQSFPSLELLRRRHLLGGTLLDRWRIREEISVSHRLLHARLVVTFAEIYLVDLRADDASVDASKFGREFENEELLLRRVPTEESSSLFIVLIEEQEVTEEQALIWKDEVGLVTVMLQCKVRLASL